MARNTMRAFFRVDFVLYFWYDFIMVSFAQQKFLDRTIAFAVRAKHVFPNPRVGCVVVKKGKIIAEGWHKKFGGLHAEVDALAKLPGGGATGATVYVSLEPCADWQGKKTSSCAKRLVRERVRRVVVGMLDPHPNVRGKGVAILQRAGIDVVIAPSRVALYDLNHEYLCAVADNDTSGVRPFVLMKTAMSLDGKIGTSDHRRVQLSTPEDAKAVDALRAGSDAIMVGGTTLRNDRPRLTVKDLRLVRARIAEGRDAQPLGVAMTQGHLVVRGSSTRRFMIGTNLGRALTILAVRYGVQKLLLEGGGELNAAMLAAGCVDVMRVATAPVILGGRTAPTLVDGDDFLSPLHARLFKRERLGTMDIAWYHL